MNQSPNTKPIRNLFHDCGYIYLPNIEPAVDEPITVRLRAEKGNVTKAYVEISYEGTEWLSYEMKQEKEDKTGYYEYFIGVIPGQNQMFKYRFRAGNENPENEVYYSRTYIGKEEPTFNENNHTPDDCWTIVPGLHTPDWAKGITWYSLLPDGFYNGDITSDEPISGENCSNPWNMPQHHSILYKYGGDIKGIEKKLQHIIDLGCEAVYTNPLFKSYHGVAYGAEFYKQIENSFGNKQAFADLAKAIHDKGLYYMIDVVLMFVADGHYWYDKHNCQPLPGAAQEWDSPYHDFFYFTGEEGDTTSYKSNWEGLTLNLANEKLQDLLWRQEDSYLQYYTREPFNVDAIRFDCGGDLSGTYPDGTRIENEQVAELIRPYLREINPEMMMLSEYSLYNSMDKGQWDSRWNLEFVKYGLPYMRGELKESFMFGRFESELDNIARPIGLCSYNSMADHDRPRITGVEPYAYRAYQLIHMTQVGMPVIFYGEEIRIQREHSTFYAMEWNEANWDYDVLNNTKALTELRKNYSALRTGIIKYFCIDDDNHLMGYARIDEDSMVLTVANRNPYAKELTIDIRDLGEVDGTIFTDWFSGKQYVTKDGYIDVILPAGGTIFVKGEASTTYKGGFKATAIGGGEAVVTAPKEGSICIAGSGSFVHTEVFNACEISALCKANEGSGMLQIRANDTQDCAWIGAEVCKDEIHVYIKNADANEVEKIVSKSISANSYVKIERNAKNRFSVYATKTLGWLWDEIVTDIHVDIPNHAKAGMTVSEGTVTFENIHVKYEKESILCDDFKHGKSAMFDFTPDMNISYGAEGMTVAPKQDKVTLTLNSCDEDWTFKTELQYQPKAEGDYAGVISMQDEDIYVVAGRMNHDGKQMLFIGRATAGKLAVYHMVSDTMPDQNITIQLQRVGTTYSAVYSYDCKTWNMIGRNIIANLCAERTGLIVNGETESLFGYASFGDAIHDGESFNTPKYPLPIFTEFTNMLNTLTQPAYRIVSGDWDYADEGLVQKSKGLAQMGVANKTHSDFKVDATYVIDEGDGYIGFEFGKKAYDSEIGDGYMFRFNSDRTVSITKGDVIFGQATLSEELGNEVKITVENRYGVLAVFAGLEGEPVLVLNEFEQTSGYLAHVMEGVVGHINNYLTASYDADFYFSRNYQSLTFYEDRIEKESLRSHIFASPFGVGVTDFVTSAKFSVTEFGDIWHNPFVGFYICAPEGKFHQGNSLTVGFNSESKVFVRNGGEVLAEAPMNGGFTDRKLKVVKKGQNIDVYVDDAGEPILTCQVASKNGGTVSLCANMAVATFKDMTLVELQPNEETDKAEN